MKTGVFTILGATGFIGSHLSDYLRREGYDVLTPERDSPKSLTRFLGHAIYCIGLTADFRSRPFDTVDAHVGRLREILDGGHFRTFTYLSSTRVYRNAAVTGEDTPLVIRPDDPDDLYNISKIMGESLCLNANRPGTRVVRLSNVYGADVTSENFLTSVLRDAVTKQKVEIHSAPDSSKDYVDVEDVVSLLLRIAESGQERIYNIASGRNTTHKDLVESIRRATDCKVKYKPGAPKIEFPPIVIDRVCKEFSFKPTHVMDRIQSLVEQFREKVRAA